MTADKHRQPGDSDKHLATWRFDHAEGGSVDAGEASFGTTPFRSPQYFDGADGGEMIQAAIDSFSRGGEVRIPIDGPDDGLTNGQGKTEDGVWAISSVINNSGQNGTHIHGGGPGWGDTKTGTALIADGLGNGRMLNLGGGFLSTISDIRFDGVSDTDPVVRFGSNNDFQISRCMIQDSWGKGLEAANNSNVWVDKCWIERCGSIGCSINMGGRYAWLTDTLFFDNDNDIRITQTPKVWIDNVRSDKSTSHSIQLQDVTDAFLSNIHLREVALNETEGYGIQFLSGGDNQTENVLIDGVIVEGASTTDYAIHRDSDVTLVDCTIRNVLAYGMGSGVFNNIIGSSNGTRTVVNGHAWNNGNPSSSGDWNGHATDAIGRGVHTVWDDSSSPPTAYTPYQTASGSGWRAKNYAAP